MHNRLTFGLTALLTLSAWLIARPAPIHAADDQCIRVNLYSTTELYQDYNPTTETLSTVEIGLGADDYFTWSDISPSGASAAVAFTPAGEQYETVRLIDAKTRQFHDVPLESAYAQSDLIQNPTAASGWSPDDQFFAVPIVSEQAEVASLNVYNKEGQLTATSRYSMGEGMGLWSWSPQSDHIAILQPRPDYFNYLSFLSPETGEITDAQIDESISWDGAVNMLWSPDGRYLALWDVEKLRVIDATTGTADIAAQNLYRDAVPNKDIVWMPHSQSLLYLSIVDETMFLFDINRYSASTQKTTVVLKQVTPVAALASTRTINQSAMIVSQGEGNTIHFILIDGITGDTHDVLTDDSTQMSVNAYVIWSPNGNAFWISSETTLLARPDMMSPFKMPEGETLGSWYQGVFWSSNEEWTGLLTENVGTGTLSPWLVNTRTGESRRIPIETPYARVFPNDDGAALIIEDSTLSLIAPGSTDKTLLTPALSYITGKLEEGVGAMWSPDGSQLAFIEDDPEGGAYIIKVLHSDGTPFHRVSVPLGESGLKSIEWVPCA